MANPFLNRLAREFDGKDDELRAAAAKVQQTMESEGWRLLWDLIGRAEQDAWDRLVGGHRGAQAQILEQAEYARIHAYLAGIREPQTAADAYQAAVERLSTDSPE